MDNEKRKILEMVGEGRITQEEALRLLDALEGSTVDQAFGQAMAQLRGGQEGPKKGAPPEAEAPQGPQPGPGPSYAGYSPPPSGGQGGIWNEMGEAAREVGQVLSETASITANAIAEGVHWAKNAVQKIPGVTLWWGEEEGEAPEGEQPLPYTYQDGPPRVEKLDIQWVRGPVEIVPWDGDWVNVTEYSKLPLSPDQQLELTVTDGGAMRIRWTRDRKFLSGFRLSKYLLVQVPAALAKEGLKACKAENVSGSVRMADVSAEDVSLSTTSGPIEAQGMCCGKLKLASVSGSVQLDNVQAGRLELGTTSGRIEAMGFGCESARLNTVSGHIQAYGNGGEIKAKSVSGRVSLQTQVPPEKVRLESLSGHVVLALPENRGFTAKFETMSGSFSSQFPVGGDLGGKSGKAVYGDGGIAVSLHTLSGKIEINRG